MQKRKANILARAQSLHKLAQTTGHANKSEAPWNVTFDKIVVACDTDDNSLAVCENLLQELEKCVAGLV